VTEDEARERAEAILRRLAEQREKLGLSKRRLAELSGLDPKAITLLERAERMPAITTLLRISAALSINLSALLAEAESGSIQSERKA